MLTPLVVCWQELWLKDVLLSNAIKMYHSCFNLEIMYKIFRITVNKVSDDCQVLFIDTHLNSFGVFQEHNMLIQI